LAGRRTAMVRLRRVLMATIRITHTHARLMDTTGLNGSQAEYSSAQAPGSVATMVGADTMVLDFTAADITAAEALWVERLHTVGAALRAGASVAERCEVVVAPVAVDEGN